MQRTLQWTQTLGKSSIRCYTVAQRTLLLRQTAPLRVRRCVWVVGLPLSRVAVILHRWSRLCVLSVSQPVELVKISFLKKFISYAKARVKPDLTDGARELIVQHYAELRQKQVDGSLAVPITARSLETIIRLSTAHAKVRQLIILSSR